MGSWFVAVIHFCGYASDTLTRMLECIQLAMLVILSVCLFLILWSQFKKDLRQLEKTNVLYQDKISLKIIRQTISQTSPFLENPVKLPAGLTETIPSLGYFTTWWELTLEMCSVSQLVVCILLCGQQK